MQIKNKIQSKKRLKTLLLIALLLLVFQVKSATAASIIEKGTFDLNVTSKKDANNQVYAELTWESVPGTSGYTLWQKEEGQIDFESKSTNYDKPIKVLNVYPDEPKSNTLKTWMETNGFGKNLIEVTPISISTFNANPKAALKTSSGEQIYDVIMFGTWDGNNGKDLSLAGINEVMDFIQDGRGVLVGHDFLGAIVGGKNPMVNNSKLAKYLNVTIVANTASRVGGTKVKIKNDGYMMKYPHLLLENTTYTIPATHTVGTVVGGDTKIWMDFEAPFGFWWGGKIDFNGPNINDSRGVSNYFLATKNNVGLIMTGHSNGAAMENEQQIIANTLFNLAQFTKDTHAADRSVEDKKAPKTPTIVADSSSTVNQTILQVDAEDLGTSYQWYVEANMLSANQKSDTMEETIISGTKGFIHLIDDSPTTPVEATKDADGKINNLSILMTNPLLTVNGETDAEKWLHIRAVDFAGNLGPTKHIQLKEVLNDFRIIEKYEDELGNELSPQTHTDVKKNSTYTKSDAATLSPHWEMKGYQIEGIYYPGTIATIPAITQHKTVTFIYKKALAQLHIRQIVLEQQDAVVLPTKGYFQLAHQTSQLNIVTPSGNLLNLGYKEIQLEMLAGQFNYQVTPIVPEYYAYAGYTISTSETVHQPEQRQKNAIQTLDYTIEEAYWLTVYLKPTSKENAPNPYSWNYQLNTLGELTP